VLDLAVAKTQLPHSALSAGDRTLSDMRETLRLGSVGRTRVSCNWSVLVVAAVITVSLAAGVLPDAAPGFTTGTYWAVGVAAALVFFASLLGHELAHAVVALRRGVPIDGIVLWALGGVTKMSGDAPDPSSELRIGVAGPLASLAIGGVLALATWGLDVAGLPAVGVAALTWLAEMNVLLAVFNLLPAYPLDGGRVLRAGLWRHSHDRRRATDLAARVGSAIGGVLVALGLLAWIADSSFAYDGVWLALVGWFVIGASRNEAAAVRLSSALAGLRVCDAMVVAGPAPSYVTVEDLVDRYLAPYRLEACAVVDFAGAPSGVLELGQLARVPRRDWRATRVSEVAWPAATLARVAPGDALEAAARQLATTPSGAAIVLDGGRIIGTVSRRDLERVMRSPRPGFHRGGAGSGTPGYDPMRRAA
jgi:Zn-dependent protease/CBS domain-containing protein